MFNASDTELWKDLITSPHETIIDASCWYDGELTLSRVPVISGTWSQQLDGHMVRSSIKLKIGDDTGELTPTHDLHPLAPLGQQIQVGVTVAAGGQQMSCPIGVFRIDDAKSTTGWTRWRDRWLPAGGVIELPAVDCIQDLKESELATALQPARGATVASELRRLTEGFCGIETKFTDKPVSASIVYDENRLKNIEALARTVDATITPSRYGGLKIGVLDSSPVMNITAEDGAKIDVVPIVSRDRIINAVVTSGQQSEPENLVRGYAKIYDGPRRADGPLHARIIRHSSSFYQTQVQAQAGAESLLAGRIDTETIEVSGTIPWNPTLDVADVHMLELWPAGKKVPAILTSLKMGLASETADATWMVDAKLIGDTYGQY